MRPQLLLGLALAACGAVAGGAAAGPRVTASVSDIKRHDLSSLLYSIFFETEINYGSEGGLYAELLPNRDFERLGRGSGPAGADGSGSSSSSNSAAAASQNASSPAPGLEPELELDPREPPPHPADFSPWTALPGTTAATDDTTHPFATNPVSLRLVTSSGGGGIENPGYWGVNARAGMAYNLTFYAELEAASATSFGARLECDSKPLTAPISGSLDHTAGWKQYTATLTATSSCDNATFVFTVDGKATLHVDSFSLMPGDAVAGLFRKDIFEKMRCVNKRLFAAIFILKTIDFPRQARDKHRKRR